MSGTFVQQIERKMEALAATSYGQKPHGIIRRSKRYLKKKKLRVERRRAKADPECLPMYRKYGGWDW